MNIKHNNKPQSCIEHALLHTMHTAVFYINHCWIATKVFIGKLQAIEGQWVIIGIDKGGERDWIRLHNPHSRPIVMSRFL